MSSHRSATRPDFQPRGREDYGAFYTPARTADFMVNLLDVREDSRVLEPAAGDGAFIDALVRAGVREERITAWELDPDACQRLRERYPEMTVVQRDALLDPELDGLWREEAFDRIIANPPYLNKASGYVRAHRAELRARFASVVGSGETFAMFLYMGLRLLRDPGRLVFIVSDTIRTLGTHERLRNLILADHQLDDVVATPSKLFPDASVRTVIMSISRPQMGTPTRVIPAVTTEQGYERAPASKMSLETLLAIDGHPFVMEAPESIVELFRQPLRMRDWATGHIGMHTRNNARYLAALKGSRLAQTFETRRTQDGHHRVITKSEARRRVWQAYLKEGGQKDFHFPIFEYLDWTPEAQATYVIPTGPDFGKPGLCVSGVSKRLSARVMEAGCYWDTNKVMGFIPRSPEDRDLLIGLLNSDLYTYIAKRLLNESSSIQINDLWKLPIPDLPAPVRKQIEVTTASCIQARRQDPHADIRTEREVLNDLVYRGCGVTWSDREIVRSFLRLGRMEDYSSTPTDPISERA